MKKFIEILDTSVYRFWLIFSFCMLIISIGIKAMYNMDDSPYFKISSIFDIAAFVVTCVLYLTLFHFAKKIEKKATYLFLWIVFGAIAAGFVFLVPLEAFSDMKYVKDGALMIAKWDIAGIRNSEYLQYIAKNLKVSLIYAIFDLFLPRTEMSLKLINVFFYLISIHFLSKTSKNFGFLYPKTLFIAIASFLPFILYCNHIYFDYPTFACSIIAIYFYTKDRNTKHVLTAGVFLAIAYSLRVLVGIFVIAIVIDYIFYYQKKLLEEKAKKLIVLVLFLVLVILIPKAIDGFVNANFRTQNAPNETIWTQFWMGINEQEFGMMHNEIYEGPEQFSDFIDLLVSRTPKENVELFSKKIFWTWTQGTYQAQRYGFGLDTMNESDKFAYHTIVTQHVLHDNQLLRKVINTVARAQYMMWFTFMIAGMYVIEKRNRAKYRIFVYSLLGTFLILIFYEMKSRYVFHCFICMVILSLVALQKVCEDKNLLQKWKQ